MSTLGTFAKYNKQANFARPTLAQLEAKKRQKELEKVKNGLGADIKTAQGSTTNQKALEMQNKLKASTAIVPAVAAPAAAAVAPSTAAERFASSTNKNSMGGKYSEGKKAVLERRGKLNSQKLVEAGSDKLGFLDSAKLAGRQVTATAGNPERALIAKGKASEGFVKGLAEGAEKFGKAGYREGAGGVRGALNKVAGRTLTGKAVRLGAAGVGIAAIGSALRKKREDQY